jgi:hypothetical protein
VPLDLSNPVYLFIHASTSLCQTREFSGLRTHSKQKIVSMSPTFFVTQLVTYMVLVRKHQQPARHTPGL